MCFSQECKAHTIKKENIYKIKKHLDHPMITGNITDTRFQSNNLWERI